MRQFQAFLYLVLLASAFMTAPVIAQNGGKTYRVGLMAVGTNLDSIRPGIVAELRRKGFIEGQNLVVDERVGPAEKLSDFSHELAQQKPDAVVAIGAPAAAAAIKEISQTTPVVGWFGSDPVALGYVESFGRPGRNVTGLLVLAAELDGKRLDILREALPGARRFGALALNPVRHAPSIKAMREVAERAGIELQIVYAESAAQYPAAFAALKEGGAQGVVIAGAREFHLDGSVLATLAREAGLPTVCEWSELAREGCLLGYGAKFEDLLMQTGQYVARIFRGASPAELPVEHPARLEFAVNLRTARVLKLEVPHAVLLRADEVID